MVRKVFKSFALVALIMVGTYLAAGLVGVTFFLDRTAEAQQAVPPTNLQPDASDSEVWREIRRGLQGQVSIPDQQAGTLVQSEGENWRNLRNGPLSVYGAWVLLGMTALLALFFAIRGRIKIDHGLSGRRIQRFNSVERFAHWLIGVSFIILAITGLNILYGRYIILPVVGKEAFAVIAQAGKWAHNHVAFAFAIGIVMVFFLWVKHNIPGKLDLQWIAKGGGLFSKNVHPDSKKFNAGQKLIFWSVVLGGASLTASGWALLFPYETAMFSKTFATLNVFGLGLPTDLSPLQEQQLQTIWHSIVSLVMIAIIIAHIYIGSVGMQGAFAAMGSGQVDVNWAKEHHNLWVEEVEQKSRRAPRGGMAAPAGGDD